jgi:hypothetical protein
MPVVEEKTSADPAIRLKPSRSHSRLSSYGPDFLEFVVNKYMAFKRGKGDYQQKLKLVTGSNAERLYRKFVGWVFPVQRTRGIAHGRYVTSTSHESDGASSATLPPTKPLVFAVASNESGKKGVKFYKTWQASGPSQASKSALTQTFHAQRKHSASTEEPTNGKSVHGLRLRPV